MLATLIPFSLNEIHFLAHSIQEASLFSDQIIVSVCDHFFNGKPQNKRLLEKVYASFPQVEFIQFPWRDETFASPHYWHNLTRLLPLHFLKPEIKQLLFIDADEIVEGEVFSKWLKTFKDTEAVHLACYWYFRQPSYQATIWEDTPLLVQREILNYDLVMQPEERAGIFEGIKGSKERRVLGPDALPMVHHYSWVRSKKELLTKVESWGHRNERDWKKLVLEEWERPFSGKDFVHGYTFKKVAPFLKKIPLDSHHSPNVCYLTQRDVTKIDLYLKFGIE